MIHPSELIVDLFAGGGGASEGIRLATGRDPDIAVNHSPDAVAVHLRNHPGTHHHCASVWVVKPQEATQGRPVGLLWASPDCRHFSRAAGGRPKWKSVRSLPGVVLTWATRVRPRVIVVENVREMMTWGPLLDDGTPCPDRIGRSWNQWIGRLRGLGYKVEWRELCAADFGAPTIRTRLFVVARCDGEPIRWPHPTHSRRPSLLELPWRTAAECIDWSIPCPSIFTRRKPLADATLRRVADGVRRYVLGAAEPFVVSLTHQGGFRGQGLGDPFATITSANRGEKALVQPFIANIDHQSSMHATAPLDAPLTTITGKARHVLVAPTLATLRGTSTSAPADAPLGTITASGTHHALICPTLVQTGYGERDGQAPRSLDLGKPLGTVVAQGQKHALVAAYLAQHNLNAIGRPIAEPMATITTSGTQTQAVTATLSAEDEAGAHQVAAFLMSYYGQGGQHQDCRSPLGAVTTRDRFALVIVNGVALPIVDIGMRMLSPAELAAAQGFPATYDMTDGGRLTKTAQVRLIGNSVCPPVAAAVVRAMMGGTDIERIAA